MTQRLQDITTGKAPNLVDCGWETLLKLQFDFQSDSGDYPDSSFYLFRRGETIQEVVAGLRKVIDHLEGKLPK